MGVVVVQTLLMSFYYDHFKKMSKGKRMIIKLVIFLSLAVVIFFNSYYAERIAGEEIDDYCSRSSNSYNFLLSEDYRKCLLDKSHRGHLIDEQIENKIKKLNVARNDGLSKLKDLNTKLMSKVNYIGVEKFVEINWVFPDTLSFFNWREERPVSPPLVKVTFNNCAYFSWGGAFSCDEQILSSLGEKVSGLWKLDAGQLPKMNFMQSWREFGPVSFYIDIPVTHNKFSFDFTVIGFEITKEHINKNIDSGIQSQTNYLNKFR